jgi:hypothetical protein
MVICNYADKPVTVKPEFETGEPKKYRLVDESVLRDIGGDLTIPPGSAAVVI